MDYPIETLDAAHRHSSNHREALQQSHVCGCFYCCSTLSAAEVEEWLDDEDGTALCPRCGIDSVIGSKSGYPVSDQHFLKAMHQRWFT